MISLRNIRSYAVVVFFGSNLKSLSDAPGKLLFWTMRCLDYAVKIEIYSIRYRIGKAGIVILLCQKRIYWLGMLQ